MTDGGSGHVRSTRRSEEALSGPAPDGPSLVNHDGAGADLTRIPRWTDGPGPGGKRADPAPGILVGNLVHPAVESAIDAARGEGTPWSKRPASAWSTASAPRSGKSAFTTTTGLEGWPTPFQPGPSRSATICSSRPVPTAPARPTATTCWPTRRSTPSSRDQWWDRVASGCRDPGDAHELEADAAADIAELPATATIPAEAPAGPMRSPADGPTGGMVRHEAGAGLLRDGSRPLLLRQGWADARTGGWNESARVIGTTLRIPIEGISQGNQAPDASSSTHESAARRAVVVVPAAASFAGGVTEVLLFFHGMNVGYRERTVAGTPGAVGTVRDVEADRIEQQLERAGRNMVAILAQGTTGASFGKADPRAYVDEVLGLLLPGLRTLRPDLTLPSRLQAGRIDVGGHSGGGRAATSAAELLQAPVTGSDAAWAQSAPLFLFDGINGPHERDSLWTKVEAWLNDDLARLTKPGANAAQLLALRGIKLRSTWGAGSDPVYKRMNVGAKYNPVTDTGVDPSSLEGRLRAWFHRNGGALGSTGSALRAQYKVESVAGSHEFTVGTGGAPSRRGVPVSPGITAPSGPAAPDYTGGGNLEASISALPPTVARSVDGTGIPRGPAPAIWCRGGLGRRVQRQLVTRQSAKTVGTPSADNLREDVLSVMDRLHLVGALTDPDYALEHGPVVAKAPGAAIAEVDMQKTIAAISANEVEVMPAWVAEKILALRLGGDVGAGMPNDRADVAQLQLRLRALGILRPADFAAENVAGQTAPITDPAIVQTRAAIKGLRVRFASGTLGWQPVRLGTWRQPDESLFGGDRFGAQTFELDVTLPTFDPATDPLRSSVNRPESVSIFVPTKVSAPPPGQPAATSTQVAVFFSPGDATGSRATNAVLVHGLRGADEGTDRVLISVPSISNLHGDGWVAVTNAAITACLDRAGLPTALGTVRLIAHSRGALGLKQTLVRKTLTATVNKVIVLDESTTFGAGGGNLKKFIEGAAADQPGGPGITMAAGGGSVSYQVNAKPLTATDMKPPISRPCARAIGYSRLIRDAVNENAAVARDLFGPAPATPSATTPDWTGIWSQLLNLPPRGQFSTQRPAPPAGMTDIYAFCHANAGAIAAMERHVAADWAERQKPRAAWVVGVIQKSPKAFCDAHGLGITSTPDIDAHHYFVAEIAHELFD